MMMASRCNVECRCSRARPSNDRRPVEGSQLRAGVALGRHEIHSRSRLVTPSPYWRVFLLFLVIWSANGCAAREYLTGPMFAEIIERNPRLRGLRVYPSSKFVVRYVRELGEDLSVASEQGAIRTDYRARIVETPVPRNLPGAILGLESHAGRPLLWVSFDRRCTTKNCAYGFVLNHDALFRLVHVPERDGYAAPRVFRTRVSPRRRMELTKLYAQSNEAPVYFTVRGLSASIALEIKRADRVDVQTVVVPQSGIPTDAPSAE